jgi:hypothetical protein
LAVIEGDIKVGALIIGQIFISLIEYIFRTLSEEAVLICIDGVDRSEKVSWPAKLPGARMRKNTLFFLFLVLLRVNQTLIRIHIGILQYEALVFRVIGVKSLQRHIPLTKKP